MDAIITYVNPLDTVWQKQYHTVSNYVNIKRYRDWDTLKYVLRGVDYCMPYIENVFLVVSGPTQIPDYVNKSTVNVVYHNDIIPEKFLPTFNSNTIETFLYRISGLSEQFVYFNDDMIPKSYISETDLFENGLPCYMKNPYDISYDINNNCLFIGILNTCNNLAKLACGLNRFFGNTEIFYTQHTLTPFLKSKCEECYNKISWNIEQVTTQLRAYKNPSQFLYSAYNYYNGDCVLKNIEYAFMSIGNTKFTLNDICNAIENEKYKSICINDHSVNFTNDMIIEWKNEITKSLNKVLPVKGKYEI